MDLAVFGTDMVWTTTSEVKQAGANGGPNTLVSKPHHRFSRPIVSGSSLFWSDTTERFAAEGIAEASALVRCTLPECKDVRTIHTAGYRSLGRFAVNGPRIYFSYIQAGLSEGDIWGIATCPTSGCGDGPVVLATVGRPPVEMAVNDSYLVWSAAEGGAALTCALPDCKGGLVPLVPRASVRDNIAIDATHAYFIDDMTRTVNRCALAGCDSPEVLADTQRLPGNLVLTDKDIYWTTADFNIVRLAK